MRITALSAAFALPCVALWPLDGWKSLNRERNSLQRAVRDAKAIPLRSSDAVAESYGDMAAWCASKRVPVDGSPKDGTRAGGAKCAREFFNRKWSDGTGKPPGPGDAGPCTLHAVHEYIYAHGDRKRVEPWTLAPAALLEAALDPATPVARAIVDAACALYETDFACFANANAHARSPGCAALVRARLAAVRR